MVIMGPTASGKSSLALKIAADFGGEIISADSMQIYRGLDIGTAKPTREEKTAVPHHLIDLFDFSARIDVYTFLKLAEVAIAEIHSRGRLPVIAGGSGMYIRALLYGIDPLPGDPELRARLDRLYDNPEGFEKLKVLMREKDLAAFERWRMHNRKLIRALEVFELTGKSIIELQTINKPQLRYPAIVWNLSWDREALRRRIEERAIQMLAAGWIDEAAAALKNGILNSPTARQSLGCRIIGEHLAGRLSCDAMREQIITATWQLARRQMTWFRRQHPEAATISMPADYPALAANLRKFLEQ
jgi:tRNA dimethylallyltransferase